MRANTLALRVAFVAMMAIASAHLRAQSAGSFDSQKFEDQAKALLQQMQDPNADQDSIRSQFRDLFQQFRDATQGMTQDQIDQIRQKMMENLAPTIQQAMPAIIRRAQQGLMDRLRAQFDCTDEEFAALKPGIQKVLDAMQASSAGGGRGPGGGPAFQIPGLSSELAAAQQALRATLAEPDAKSDVIKAKLDAFRAAKEKALHDLDVARAELRPLLTVRQESVLVANGILE